MPMTALPAAPSTSSPSDFAAKADALLAALPGFVTEANALEAAVDADKTAAAGSASAASGSASTATTQAGTATTKAGEALTSANNAAASAAAAAGSASTSAGWSATSTTSMTPSAAQKTITVQTGKQFTAGTNIKVFRTSAPTTTYAFAAVDSYNTGNGQLVFTIGAGDFATPGGPYTDWTVQLSGGKGATGATGTVPAAVSADIVANALEIATLKGSSAGLSSGVADAFVDAAGVDAPGSTNEVYDATNDLYYNSRSSLDVGQPAQTTNSAPTGYVTSASSEGGGSVAAWKAFDQDNGTTWQTFSAAPGWVKRQFPTVRRALTYTVRTASTLNATPIAWTLDGSNDDSAWTTLDTQTGQSIGVSASATYSISAPADYLYYRLSVSAVYGAGSVAEVAELSFTFTAGPIYTVMSLRSVAYTALSAPATAMITVAADLNGGAINTDLIAYASRDNGTTWTAITLTAGRALADGTTIYDGSASIAAQPSGTNMKWRVDTSDDFDVQASAVVFQWS